MQRLRDAHEKEMTRLGFELEQARTEGQLLSRQTVSMMQHVSARLRYGQVLLPLRHYPFLGS